MTVTVEALELSTTGFVPCSGPAERYVGDDRGPARCEYPAAWVIWATCGGNHPRYPICDDCMRELDRLMSARDVWRCTGCGRPRSPAYKFGEL